MGIDPRRDYSILEIATLVRDRNARLAMVLKNYLKKHPNYKVVLIPGHELQSFLTKETPSPKNTILFLERIRNQYFHSTQSGIIAKGIERRRRIMPPAVCQGDKVPPPLKKGEGAMTPPWKQSLALYQNKDLRTIKFPCREEMNKVANLLYDNVDLQGMPCQSPDGISLIVPVEAIDLLKSEGLNFDVSEVLDHSNLTPEEIAEIRRNKGT